MFAVWPLSRPCRLRLIGQRVQICAKNCRMRLDSEQMMSETTWMSFNLERMSADSLRVKADAEQMISETVWISFNPARTSADSLRIKVDPEQMMSETVCFSPRKHFLRAENNFSSPRCRCFTLD